MGNRPSISLPGGIAVVRAKEPSSATLNTLQRSCQSSQKCPPANRVSKVAFRSPVLVFVTFLSLSPESLLEISRQNLFWKPESLIRNSQNTPALVNPDPGKNQLE
jgi:hypothetical protein